MAEQKALVGNVADPEQIKNASKKISEANLQRQNDMRELLSLRSGAFKRFCQMMLAECKVCTTVWSQSAAIHRDAGRQEIGHLLLRRIVEVDQAACAELLTEGYKKELEGEPL